MDYPELYARNGLLHSSVTRLECIPWKALQVGMSLGVLWPLLCHTHPTYCSAGMYPSTSGLHSTPATLTWDAISRNSSPRFSPRMVTLVPPSRGPVTGLIWRNEPRERRTIKPGTRILPGEGTDEFLGLIETLINAEQVREQIYFRYSENPEFCPRPHLLSFNYLQNIQR